MHSCYLQLEQSFASAKDYLRQVRAQTPHDQSVLAQSLDTLENQSIRKQVFLFRRSPLTFTTTALHEALVAVCA